MLNRHIFSVLLTSVSVLAGPFPQDLRVASIKGMTRSDFLEMKARHLQILADQGFFPDPKLDDP